MNLLEASAVECQKISLNRRLSQSYEKFLQRLKTYELYRWFAKPAEFSPIECAKRGWINLNKDTLKCVTCASIFYFYTQSTETIAKQSNLSDANRKKSIYHNDPKQLVEKHNKNCPWRTLCVSDQIIQIDLYNEITLYSAFLKRINTFKQCRYLPVLNDSATFFSFDLTSLDSSIVDKTNPNLISIYDCLNKKKFKINRTAFLMASSGWTFNEKNTVNCEKCLRSIGLWLYKTEANLYDTNSQKAISIATPTPTKSRSGCDGAADDNLGYLNRIQMNQNEDDSETVATDILRSLINQIEVNHEAYLKNRLDYLNNDDHQQSPSKTQQQQQQQERLVKKRKFSNYDDDNEEREEIINKRSCISETKSYLTKTYKLFDAVGEHFNWCPWQASYDCKQQDNFKLLLNKNDINQANNTNNANNRRRNVSQMHFDIIKRHLIKLKDSSSSTSSKTKQQEQQLSSSSSSSSLRSSSNKEATKNLVVDAETSLTSENLLEKIKSIQSLLINCTSSYPTSMQSMNNNLNE